MRFVVFVAVAAFLTAARSPVCADPRSVAVFDFELIDSSLEGELNGPRADEQQRLSRLAPELRARLAASGSYRVVDISPVSAQARSMNLQACGGCDADLAAQLGAELAITGTVQKISNLILNMNIYVRDAASRAVVERMSADFRSNTDESWSRALAWLIRNRLLAVDTKAGR